MKMEHHMRLLDIFKKKTADTTSAPLSFNFTDNEIAFLQYSAGHSTDINTFSKHFFYNYDLDYKKTLQKLLNSNLLRISTVEESLNVYTASELKDYLKQKGFSTTGKKEILIERIISQTTGYADFFTKRTYSLTPEGKLIVEDYNNKATKHIQHIVFTTISSIRSGDLETIYPLYETTEPFKNPLALPYDKDSIKKDVNAINQYRLLCHDTDRELAACIVSIMLHQTIKSSIKVMKTLGYEDVSEPEIYIAFSSITNLRNIATFRETSIEKYRLSSCKDERVCENCKKMDGKIFPLSKVQLGKTIPPFCDKCRCCIHPIFKFEE